MIPFHSRPMSARSVHRLHLLLLAIYAATAALVWPSLPDRIPIHFDLAGDAMTWARPSLPFWFGLPALALAMDLFVRGLGSLALRVPELWNIPEKKRFLALSAQARAPVEESLRAMLAWAAVLATLLFVGIHLGMYATATGRTRGWPWYSDGLIFGSILLMFAVVGWFARKSGKQIREAARRSASGDNCCFGPTGV